jgi:hypothetical protein
MRLKRVSDMGNTVRRLQSEKVVHEDIDKESKEVSDLVSEAFSATNAKMVKIASAKTEDLLDQLAKKFKINLKLERLNASSKKHSKKVLAAEEEESEEKEPEEDEESEEDEDEGSEDGPKTKKQKIPTNVKNRYIEEDEKGENAGADDSLSEEDKEPSVSGVVASREKISKTIAYPAIVNNYDPDYSCTVKLHKPQKDLIAVSVYLFETSIGQYAYKNNFFFKAGSEMRAARCFKRVLSVADDIRELLAEGEGLQHEVPLLFQRKLQGEETEYRQDSKWNVAVYLDPKNVAKFRGGKENFPNMRDQRSHFKT